jgi:EAL domain-containing protein (putative c-di-GMP-specific phosphodiesterase class I)
MNGGKGPKLSLAVLQRAVRTGEFFLVYQPKLDLRTGAVCGVEALARWQSLRHGAIPPLMFVRRAEEIGLIDWLTEWVLRSAVRQRSAWQKEGVDVEMAVNISALNLKDVNFPDFVDRLCAEEGVSTGELTLELTEGATQETIKLIDTISRLRLKGFGASLDDFGTGYGSLVQLRQLPFTELKIDRAFVGDLLISSESRSITRMLIQLAHELGLSVTAEGVEDYQTLEALTAFGCDKAQGFFIARPMTADRFPIWLKKHARGKAQPMVAADKAVKLDAVATQG